VRCGLWCDACTLHASSQPAQTDGERACAVVCMIVGAFIFAYVVGSVCSIATGMSADTTA
jgi:hypothetical protein